MGLLQKAAETYDAMAYRAGIEYAEEKEPLAPLFHIITRAQLEITLNRDGQFVSARAVGRDAPKIIIPATEESAGRTSAPCAHPLCDQLGYVSPYDEKKHALYIEALSNWANSEHSHPKLQPILTYVCSGTILSDLLEAELITLTSDGGPDNEKLTVCWVVNGLGEQFNGPCWTDQALMRAYIAYCRDNRPNNSYALCMVSGETDVVAEQHPKGIIPFNGNAKLISSNDSAGFTYRGRFSEAQQAATVGRTASQKVHNALRWLVANQSVSYGGRTFLCWNPQGIPIPGATGFMRRKSETEQRAVTPSQYKKQLRESLSGWKEALPPDSGAVIAAFDAATTGRLAVTYYNELLANDFLERLHNWESTCCWENGRYGIQSPSLFQIVSLAFGTPRNGKAEIDDRILKQQMQRLATCRIDKTLFPFDIERALAEKASRLALYEREQGRNLLFTACAAIRKYHYDHFEEEWDMALDNNCSDRSYLFGRLLAVADAVENSAYTDEDRRETNALRMQKVFALRPMTTWRFLEEKLEPYYKRLKPGLQQHFRRITQEIAGKLSVSDGELNQKLDDIYLLGFYHQRAYRSEKNNQQTTEEEI